MTDKKNNRRFLKCFLSGMLIVCFLCIYVLSFNTCCLAEIALNPYCTGDTDRIEELTTNFIEKYGEDVEINRDEVSGAPIRVTGINTEVFEGKPEEIVFTFLSENASFFGINSNDIEFSWLTEALGNKDVHFKQLYKGVPVFETKINVHIKKDGSIGSVRSEYYYHCLDLDVVPNITKEQAAAVIMEDLGVTELFSESEVRSSSVFTYILPPWGDPTTGNLTPYSYAPPPSYVPPQRKVVKTPASIELLIYPKHGDAYLCWEIEFNLGESSYIFHYYIDAHTGEIVDSNKTWTAYPSATSSDNSSQNTTITPSNIYMSQVNGNSGSGFPGPYLNPTFSIPNQTQNYGRYSSGFLLSLNSSPYMGNNYSLYYPERYAFPVNLKEPYGGSVFPYNYSYPHYSYTPYSNPYPALSSGFFNLFASSNLNTVQQGIEMMYNYWPSF